MTLLFGPDSERPAAVVDAELALRAPFGALSPLWFYFTGVASAGVAYWWMTRWAGVVNLEAMKAEATALVPILETPPEPLGGEASPLQGAALLAASEEVPPAPVRPRVKPKSET